MPRTSPRSAPPGSPGSELTPAAELSVGDLFKLQCAPGASQNAPCRAVYYLDARRMRRVFPTVGTYNSWYANFDGVQTVAFEDLISFPIGGNVPYRPGSRILKSSANRTLYAVSRGWVVRPFASAAAAKAVYGARYQSFIETVPDAFFAQYRAGAPIRRASAYNPLAELEAAPTIDSAL